MELSKREMELFLPLPGLKSLVPRISKLILNPLEQMKSILKKKFLIRGLEVGKIIPFPVWKIPFPVLKINFETLETTEKHFVKEVF